MSQNIHEKELTIKDIIKAIKEFYFYLLSKWHIILLIGLFGASLGFLFGYISKPVYTATTSFVLEDGDGGGISQYSGVAAMVGIDLGGSSGGLFKGENIIELYKSRKMIEKTLLSPAEMDKSGKLLIDKYLDFNQIRQKWRDPKLKNISFFDRSSFTIKHDSIISVIVNDLNKNYLNVFKPDKKLSILKVQVKSKNELFAKNFNDQIVSTVNNFYIETKTKKSIENVSILQRQTDSVRAVMDGSLYRAASTIDATPNINRSKQVLIAPAQRSQFNAETNKAILTELVKNLELSKIALRRETPLIQVIDSPVLPVHKEKFGKLEGLIIGGGLAGIFIVIYLLVLKFIKELK